VITTVTVSGDELQIIGDPEFAAWAEELITNPGFAQQKAEMDADLRELGLL